MIHLEIVPGGDTDHPENNEIKITDAETKNMNEIVDELKAARQNYLADPESVTNFFTQHANDPKIAFSVPFFYSKARDQNAIDSIKRNMPQIQLLDSAQSHHLSIALRKMTKDYYGRSFNQAIAENLKYAFGEDLGNIRHANINFDIAVDEKNQNFLDRIYIIAENNSESNIYSFRFINPDAILVSDWHHMGESHDDFNGVEGLTEGLIVSQAEEHDLEKHFNITDTVYDVVDDNDRKLFTDREVSFTPKIKSKKET